jgi:hypothetical protein
MVNTPFCGHISFFFVTILTWVFVHLLSLPFVRLTASFVRTSLTHFMHIYSTMGTRHPSDHL